ncbi:DUF4328 domain-containing protein [Gordonia hankookensis]|uniref:DUF4328 domain-containing protein n=1 Tax=Gordonia hankookensis TaxID=589403 RepID=A0ABR7WC11_9ACTN|nr:DUF4328 domain-containing protein [Gordonia hankookensis]
MIDLCPRCRIQAPHRPGRERCPRCGGPLRVVDSDLIGDPGGAVETRRGPSASPRETPVRPTASSATGQPSSGPRSSRLYRARHVRWVARRPPEAIPARRLAVPPGPRPIPRYVYVPRWGLRDVPVEPGADHRNPLEALTAALLHALRLLAGALGLAAIVHLLRYVLLVVNRSVPVAGWTDRASAFLVIFAGLVAFGVFVYATVVFTRWIITLRDDAYRRHALRDPRPRWQIALLAAVPLVNVAGAAVLLHEVARIRDDLEAERTRSRLTKLWVAWALVNVLAAIAVVTRIVATASGSIQTSANGLAAVVISSAVSGVFAWWLGTRLMAIFGAPQDEPVPSRRWVAVA